MFKILGEDKVMVEKLRPELLEKEYSLAPDRPQIAFRNLRDEYIHLGFGTRQGLGRKRAVKDTETSSDGGDM